LRPFKLTFRWVSNNGINAGAFGNAELYIAVDGVSPALATNFGGPVDSTVACAFDLTAQWSDASADNAIALLGPVLSVLTDGEKTLD
jgi:hypothetical protein